jgi:CRISPR-associated protein Csm3
MKLKLTHIITIKSSLKLLTGLHIGAGDGMMQIGGVDNQVIRHPVTKEPYIPGSSLKGKIRSLLEWRSGAVKEEPLGWQHLSQPGVLPILKLFGGSGDAQQMKPEDIAKVGPSRLSFWDCFLQKEWLQRMREDNQPWTEVKSENRINRISGTAQDPRQTERVPAGAIFDFRLSFKYLEQEDANLLPTVLAGLKLLELDSLGGSGSRGYGKVKFEKLVIDGQIDGQEDAAERFAKIDPFKGQG